MGIERRAAEDRWILKDRRHRCWSSDVMKAVGEKTADRTKPLSGVYRHYIDTSAVAAIVIEHHNAKCPCLFLQGYPKCLLGTSNSTAYTLLLLSSLHNILCTRRVYPRRLLLYDAILQRWLYNLLSKNEYVHRVVFNRINNYDYLGGFLPTMLRQLDLAIFHLAQIRDWRRSLDRKKKSLLRRRIN